MKIAKSTFIEVNGTGYLSAEKFSQLTKDQMQQYLEWYPNSSHWHIYNELYSTDEKSVSTSKSINKNRKELIDKYNKKRPELTKLKLWMDQNSARTSGEELKTVKAEYDKLYKELIYLNNEIDRIDNENSD